MGPARAERDGGGLRNPPWAVISANDRQRSTLHISNTFSKPVLGRAVNASCSKTPHQAFLTGRRKFDSIPDYFDSRRSDALKSA